MQEALEALIATGFSEYEARAYCALLAQSPANGYQMAKRSVFRVLRYMSAWKDL